MIDTNLRDNIRVDTIALQPPALPTIPNTTPLTNNVRTTNNVTPQTLSQLNVDVGTLLSTYATLLTTVATNINTISQQVLNADITT